MHVSVPRVDLFRIYCKRIRKIYWLLYVLLTQITVDKMTTASYDMLYITYFESCIAST